MIIIMGVSGCGKTTIGKILEQQVGLPFYDADDFHPESNVLKMKSNIPLNDEDRQPWLESLADHMNKWENKGGFILACSALKERYRKILMTKVSDVNWVYLFGSFDLIKSRLEQRNQHYMKSSLLQSQFDDLELPDYGLHVSIGKSPSEIVSIITSNYFK